MAQLPACSTGANAQCSEKQSCIQQQSIQCALALYRVDITRQMVTLSRAATGTPEQPKMTPSAIGQQRQQGTNGSGGDIGKAYLTLFDARVSQLLHDERREML